MLHHSVDARSFACGPVGDNSTSGSGLALQNGDTIDQLLGCPGNSVSQEIAYSRQVECGEESVSKVSVSVVRLTELLL